MNFKGIPIVSRQKIMKDLFLIEKIVDILNIPFTIPLFDMESLGKENPEIIKVKKSKNII